MIVNAKEISKLELIGLFIPLTHPASMAGTVRNFQLPPRKFRLRVRTKDYIQGRDEIGGVYLPSQLTRTLQLVRDGK